MNLSNIIKNHKLWLYHHVNASMPQRLIASEDGPLGRQLGIGDSHLEISINKNATGGHYKIHNVCFHIHKFLSSLVFNMKRLKFLTTIYFLYFLYFSCIGGSPLGAPQVPPRLHRYILRWQNHVKAKIAQIVAKILRVAAVIACVTAKFGIWGGKNMLVCK